MPRPRSQLVDVNHTPYYHVTSRCVRRAYLCGFDRKTKKSYRHRQKWIEKRIRYLSSVFSIDVLSYAVMSNHYHIVVRINQDEAKNWSEHQVMQRWSRLYKGTLLFQKYRDSKPMSSDEVETARATVEIYRNRLADLSWFMKCLNESIARRANREDNCTGHFWESRFTSQALATKTALITCMVYVDLNPIRAGKAHTLKTSTHTSVRVRLMQDASASSKVTNSRNRLGPQRNSGRHLKPLVPFLDQESNSGLEPIPISFYDYIELANWTKQAVRSGKQRALSSRLESAFNNVDRMLPQCTQFEKLYRRKQIS